MQTLKETYLFFFKTKQLIYCFFVTKKHQFVFFNAMKFVGFFFFYTLLPLNAIVHFHGIHITLLHYCPLGMISLYPYHHDHWRWLPCWQLVCFWDPRKNFSGSPDLLIDPKIFQIFMTHRTLITNLFPSLLILIFMPHRMYTNLFLSILFLFSFFISILHSLIDPTSSSIF